MTSSQTVYEDVGRGEVEIGVTGEANIKPMIDQGFPVEAVYPTDGTGLRFDASAIIKGGPNEANARTFLDFANSKEAHEIVASTNRRSVRPESCADPADRDMGDRGVAGRRGFLHACDPGLNGNATLPARGGRSGGVAVGLSHMWRAGLKASAMAHRGRSTRAGV